MSVILGVVLGISAFVLVVIVLSALAVYLVGGQPAGVAETTSPPASAGRWALTYQNGRKQKTVRVDGDDEAQAMRNALTVHKITYDRIVSLTKEG